MSTDATSGVPKWEQTSSFIRRTDGLAFPHPSTMSGWVEDMRKWPEISYGDIFNYFVLSLGVDGAAMENYKSTEAYQYLHSGKVGRVLLHTEDGYVFLKADVNPSQASRMSHLPWVLVSSSGAVETTGCSCIAGLGRSCSHAAAILWKVENAVSSGITGISCTDQQRLWNVGTQKNLGPKRLTDITFSHHRATDVLLTPERMPNHVPLPPTPSFRSQDELKEGLKHLRLPVSSLLKKCVNARGHEPQQPASPPHADHDGTNICQRCMLFYNTFVAISPHKCTTLEHVTVEQSASHLWHDSRKIRITASTAKKVPIRGNPEKFIREHLYPRFHGNAATQHGLESEQSAFRWLEESGYAVSHRGTVVCESEPWLSASPDGVLNAEELLEIKCPFLRCNESLEDLIRSHRYDVRMVEGMLQLQQNGSRGFYMQVQLGMFCT